MLLNLKTIVISVQEIVGDAHATITTMNAEKPVSLRKKYLTSAVFKNVVVQTF